MTNRHYTETRCVSRLQGQIEASIRYGNDDELEALNGKLNDTIAALVNRGIPSDSIQHAIAHPIYAA